MSWLRNALLRLFMSKEAREKMDAYHSALRRGPQSGDFSSPEPMSDEETVEAATAAATRIARAEGIDRTEERPRGPERLDPSIGGAELIRRAMALHKEKQAVLAGLDDRTRRKLADAAMQAFFNERPKT
jgi:hypothetical protein